MRIDPSVADDVRLGKVLELPGGHSTAAAARRLQHSRAVRQTTCSGAGVTPRLRPFARSRFCMVTTHEPGGTTLATRTRFALEGEHLLVRTPSTSDLASRVWRSSSVTIAPCTRRGRALGPPIEAAARVVSAPEERAAEAALAARDGPLERLRLRIARRRGVELLYVEFVPLARHPHPQSAA
jgi:uncharacterized protein